ncbi:MAG: large subunit ribosomal protein [Blastocatellia bacterium]|jgi:large subunit ribosomal protein L4|nr:large subunit ribosomal protein [Blastocatellia bacterium]
MPTVKIMDLTSAEVGEIELADAVFGVALNEPLIHEAVRSFLANRRAGTSATKTRGDVSGSGRKLWKQKGTGRARIASLRSPLWKGGGNAHGPQPRDWSYSLPKKMRKRAICSALSERLREGNLIIVDEWKFEQGKTKEFISTLGNLKLGGKTLIVDSLKNTKLILASRNVQSAKVVNSFGLNVYDLVNYQKLVLTPRTVEELTGILQPRAKDEEENRYRSNSGEGEGAESRQLPTDTGAQA